MNDKVTEAIETLRVECGFARVSVWAPGDEEEERELLALFFAKDDDSMTAAAIDLVTGSKRAS